MSAVSACIVCSRPLDDDRKRRADATTCSRACRTALWRARRKIRREGGVPYVGVSGDGSATLARYDPPASPALSPSDARFARQLRQLEESARLPTGEDRRLRRLQRANPGVLLEPYRQRMIEAALRAQAAEEEAIRASAPMAVQDVIHNPDPTVIARRGMASRHANRHLTGDPSSWAGQPPSGPSGSARYPGTAPEADMISAPGRNAPRWMLPG
jgi:hypothetical protein